MQITQNYARPSSAQMQGDNLAFEMSAEASRPGVRLSAIVRDSPAYARAMLALHRVVSSDLRFTPKDNSAYQEWVQGRYLEMIEETHAARLSALPAQREELGATRAALKPLQARASGLLRSLPQGALWDAKGKYWKYLYTHNKALWYLLDPVVSVHPDAVLFEVFSLDESSYGRVVVPMEKLDSFGTTQWGTTNVDFSQRLADELKRVRSYRPAMLEVGASGVSVGTSAGAQFEKKIDLPPSWVRGFLQVQSAAGLPGENVTLSASTVAEMLAVLRERREKIGPRSIRFKLVPGEFPVVVLDPWDIEIQEREHRWMGESAQEIRIWGRRRLLTFEDMLPFADRVGVKLLGSGMPSYWTVEEKTGGHRFELGLSGWTENDWSSAARFDLLSSLAPVSSGDIELAASQLETALRLSPDELAARSDLGREAAGAALQQLCRDGRALFDIAGGFYRWRQLLPFPVPQSEEDGKLKSARAWIESKDVQAKELKNDIPDFLQRFAEKGLRLFEAKVKTPGGAFEPTVGIDNDGRAAFAQCTCGYFRTNKLKKGPCGHILAASVVASQILARGNQDTERFQNQTWVFTGALTLFTREAAETTIQNGGGAAAGSVSKNTSFLVAGERAGSKLAKAQSLGVPVLTEAEFMRVLDGTDPKAIVAQRAS